MAEGSSGLYLTDCPTSKIRVKRDRRPPAVRQTPLLADDLIEWQISYITSDKRHLVELGEMLHWAYRYKFVCRKDLESVLKFAEQVTSFFDSDFGIVVQPLNEEWCNFQVLMGQHPILRRHVGADGTHIEIELKHKQRAVGYQPMLYILIPVRCVKPDLQGRTADKNQTVEWSPSKEIMLETAKAFAVASKKHRDDIIMVIKKVLAAKK